MREIIGRSSRARNGWSNSYPTNPPQDLHTLSLVLGMIREVPYRLGGVVEHTRWCLTNFHRIASRRGLEDSMIAGWTRALLSARKTIATIKTVGEQAKMLDREPLLLMNDCVAVREQTGCVS